MSYSRGVVPSNASQLCVFLRHELERIQRAIAATSSTWDDIDGKPANITAFEALIGSADTVPYFTGVGAMALASLTPYARTLLACLNAGAARALLDVYSTSQVYTMAQVDALMPARAVTVITTASLVDLAFEQSSVVVPFYTGDLIKITADRACWVRFYGTNADRVTDSVRTLGTTAAAGIGLLAEFLFSASVLSVNVSPIAELTNNDGPRAKLLYYSIENMSAATHTVVISITVVPTEK